MWWISQTPPHVNIDLWYSTPHAGFSLHLCLHFHPYTPLAHDMKLKFVFTETAPGCLPEMKPIHKIWSLCISRQSIHENRLKSNQISWNRLSGPIVSFKYRKMGKSLFIELLDKVIKSDWTTYFFTPVLVDLFNQTSKSLELPFQSIQCKIRVTLGEHTAHDQIQAFAICMHSALEHAALSKNSNTRKLDSIQIDC